MSEAWWDDDEQLLAALGSALREGPPPDRVVEAAKAAFAWRGIDAELAALSHDSARTPELAAVRAERAPLRAMTFTAANLSIEIEVGTESVVGQVLPPQPGEIEVLDERSTAVARAAVDEVGSFVVRPLPAGRFRLLCRIADGRDVLTDWVTA